VDQNVKVEIVGKRIGVGVGNLHSGSVDTDVDDNGSLDSSRDGTKGGGSDPAVSGTILAVQEDHDISVNTSLEDIRGGEAAEGLGRGGDGGSQGVFDLQSTLKVINGSRNKLVDDVGFPVIVTDGKELEIGADSDIGVGGKRSAFGLDDLFIVVDKVGIEFCFDVLVGQGEGDKSQEK